MHGIAILILVLNTVVERCFYCFINSTTAINDVIGFPCICQQTLMWYFYWILMVKVFYVQLGNATDWNATATTVLQNLIRLTKLLLTLSQMSCCVFDC